MPVFPSYAFERCANMCDVADYCEPSFDASALCDHVLAQTGFSRIDRVYVGSYFCDRLFLALSDAALSGIARVCRERAMHATLVLPIFSQAALSRGVDRADAILAGHRGLFDEVVVNDIGMARHAARRYERFGVGCGFGRLLSRDARDPRYWATTEGMRPCGMDAGAVRDLCPNAPIASVELDPFAPLIDASPLAGLPVALHLPHCFMSTGHICEAASVGKPVSRRYRPDAACARECMEAYTLTESAGWETMPETCFAKMGRTVYFENPSCIVAGGRASRIIWSPSDFRCGLVPAGATEEGAWA